MTFAEQFASVRRTLHREFSRILLPRTKRPWQQLLALKAISRGEVTTQADLAERLVVDAPAASRLVAKLVKEGLLQKRKGADRRCVNLEVTASAWKDIEVFDDAVRLLDEQVRRHLPKEDLESAMRALTTLQQGLQATIEQEERAKLR